MTHVLGIDVSKARLDCALTNEPKTFSVPNTHSGIARIFKVIRKQGVELVVLEATGGYEREACQGLANRGVKVARVNPRQVRDFARSLGLLAKTDALDAHLLARFGAVTEPRPYLPLSEILQAVAALLKRRRQVTDTLTREKTRLKQAEALVAPFIRECIDQLKRQRRELDARLKDLIKQDEALHERVQLLCSVKGLSLI